MLQNKADVCLIRTECCGRKWLWPNLRYYPVIFLGGLRKTMNNLNWDSWPVGSICVIDILVMFKCIADVVLGMQNQQNEVTKLYTFRTQQIHELHVLIVILINPFISIKSWFLCLWRKHFIYEEFKSTWTPILT